MSNARLLQRPARIMVGAYQIRDLSNGGMESATRIFEVLKEQFDWSLVTTRELPRTQRWRRQGARVTVTPFAEDWPKWLQRSSGLLWSARLAREIVAFRPDVVHFNDIQSYKAYSFIPTQLKRVPLVFTLRGMRPSGEPYVPIWRKLAHEVAAVVVLSEEMGHSLVQAVPEFAGKTRVIHSIVDVDSLAPRVPAERKRIREELGIGRNEYAIGCVGAVREKKGQLDLLQNVIPNLSKMVPSASFYFLGDADADANPFCSKFRQVAADTENAGNFRIMGHIQNLEKWYAALDLVLIPSETEGLSRAMIEAMGAGLPVVSTAVCSATEMLVGTGAGRVVPIGDYDAILQAIVHFAEKVERLKAGVAGRKLALARFGEATVARQWLSLYQDVAQDRP